GTGRDPRFRRSRKTTCGGHGRRGERRSGDPAHGVPLDVVGPPHHRRRRGCPVPLAAEESARTGRLRAGPERLPARAVMKTLTVVVAGPVGYGPALRWPSGRYRRRVAGQSEDVMLLMGDPHVCPIRRSL